MEKGTVKFYSVFPNLEVVNCYNCKYTETLDNGVMVCKFRGKKKCQDLAFGDGCLYANTQREVTVSEFIKVLQEIEANGKGNAIIRKSSAEQFESIHTLFLDTDNNGECILAIL